MRTPAVPTALAVTALLALAAGCGSNDASNGVDGVPSPETTSAAPAPTTSAPATTPPTSAAPAPTTASPSPSVQQIRITVAGGTATGNTGVVRVKKGAPFQVVVTSDVADEVHVHSETRAGFSGDVAAGRTATVDAVVKVAGKYEVELEERKLKLVTLEVR